MKLSRPASWFLLAFGVWSWLIWITFVKNLWNDASGLAFDDAGEPTAYFWVHLVLAVTSFLLGTAVGVIGLRGLRALRREGGAGTDSGAAAGTDSAGAQTAGPAGSAG
ncbi:SCO4848 family membrane protein [Streptomyces sp. NPDC048639]|uniref:SCO4848 family membrane protein n=1 Tax=Streptomyces sp. NPDC048639 TaxID=3365581 RepID=UPI003712FEE4